MIFPSPPKTTSTELDGRDEPVGPVGPSPFATRPTDPFSGTSSASLATRFRSLPFLLPLPPRQTGPSGAPAHGPASGPTGHTGPKTAEGIPVPPSGRATDPNRRVTEGLTGSGIVLPPESGNPTARPPRVPSGPLPGRHRTRIPRARPCHGFPSHRDHDRFRPGGTRS